MVTTDFRRSPLALTILGLLEDGPLHPYRMQQLIKQWGKDQVVNVGQRATLYKTINRLAEAGLIEVHETTRDHLYPERTTYQLTGAGRAASRQWLAEILSTPRNEFPEFPAALSFLPMISPRTTRDLLTTRRKLLVQRLADRDALIGAAGFELPRVTMLETEHLHAVTEAEIRWIDTILAGLDDGSITWDEREPLEVPDRLESR
ncbi:PadR family transcriptional regulator [Dactylosporangium sp. NBC_01737]|uniref:PadR family transcriptional regulator n=1 Tax=Dactylosporangium sp. NBC_01737 TaxID=2975959 RepID=UPI002E113285|nr:PadR family transcriptional regulator [Dactylosporangium sp. NBC_01737]